MSAYIHLGEISLIYIGGKYSHAVRKWPHEGGFLTNRSRGARTESMTPSAAMKKTAEESLAFFSGEKLYARVDGVEVEGEFTVSEVELIEPGLFLDMDFEAPGRFAHAIARVLK